MRKLGLRAEAAVARVKLFQRRGSNLIDEGQRKLAIAAREGFVLLDCGHDACGGVERLVAAVAPDLRHGLNHAAEAGTTIAVVGRKIGAAKVWVAIGSEECRQRPAALPADGRNRGLITRVHVGALVTINLYSNKKLVDERRNRWILVGLAVHDVAPVAPYGANVE